MSTCTKVFLGANRVEILKYYRLFTFVRGFNIIVIFVTYYSAREYA